MFQCNTVNVLILLQMICIEKNELLPAIKMVKLVHPELQRRAIAHHCEWAETDFMTHFEILKYVIAKDKKEVLNLYHT